MSNHLKFATLKAARNRSAEIALANGCGRDPADVTRFWFHVRENDTTREVAIAVDTTDESKLTSDERRRLATLGSSWEQAGPPRIV